MRSKKMDDLEEKMVAKYDELLNSSFGKACTDFESINDQAELLRRLKLFYCAGCMSQLELFIESTMQGQKDENTTMH